MILGLIPILLASAFAQQSTSANIPLCPVSVPEYKDPDHMVRPVYPKAALKAGTEGSVQLRVVVGPDGKAISLTVLNGDAIFQKPTLDAVRTWHFHPVLVKEQSVETTYTVEMRFVLVLQEAVPKVTLESPRVPEPSLPEPSEALRTLPDGVYRAAPGSGITAPTATYQPDPEFSEEARKAKESGKVVVRLVVGTDGVPQDLQLRCGALPSLNEKAIEAVQQWKFKPGTKDDKPVPVEVDVEVEFKLF